MTATCDPQVAADFLRALAHPMRLQILCRLLEGGLAVSGFETELHLKQPNLSQQLSHLRDAGLVETRRDGKSIFYSLADERVGVILQALRAMHGAKAERPTTPAPRWRPDRAAPRAEECGRFAVAGWPARQPGAR